jgi:TetR/AcrR family transcriptional regulator, regulator of autoinduction and epiphytic fitness
VGVPADHDVQRADGRSLRRLRNEQAAVDAILDLLGEGVVQPTAQEVADRSGVSIRSIFRLFQDMEALNAAAVERQLARVGPTLARIPATGPVAARIAALADDRARFYEAVAPVRRLAVRRADQSPALASGLARADRHFREQVAEVFAPELSDAGPDAGDLLEALDATTSWEAWDRLRRAQDLPVGTAHRLVVRTLSALLPGTDDDRED